MSTITVYTASTDNRDRLCRPEVIVSGARYVCFSNHLKPVEPWEIIPVPVTLSDPVRQARWCKIVGWRHFTSTYSIWMDATYNPRSDPFTLAYRHLLHSDIAAFPHFERTCIYAEGQQVRADCLDDPAVVTAHLDRLRLDGYPENHGLFDTSILVRRSSRTLVALSGFWWSVLATGSRRDQLSFNYALWKLRVACTTIQPGTTRRRGNLEETFQPYFSAVFRRPKTWMASH